MTTKLTLPAATKMLSKDFTYGVATASFQIEGGIDSRLPCIWDTFCNTPNKIADASTGEVACDHYNRWQGDIELVGSLGVDAYRLSISWPRVIKESGELNPEGVAYYISILDELKRFDEAIYCYKRVIQIEPNLVLPHYNLSITSRSSSFWSARLLPKFFYCDRQCDYYRSGNRKQRT